MATYKLNAPCFIDGVLQKEGTVIQVPNDRIAGSQWEAVDKDAQTAIEKQNKSKLTSSITPSPIKPQTRKRYVAPKEEEVVSFSGKVNNDTVFDDLIDSDNSDDSDDVIDNDD
jgi:hypothetical protein